MIGVLARVGRCLPSRWRQRLKREILLRRPSLYAARFIQYERSLAPDEWEALRAKLEATLDVPGDVVECGCFLCGTTISMARHLQTPRRAPPGFAPAQRGRAAAGLRPGGAGKQIYACDTFAGFDPRELAHARGTGDATSRHDFSGNDLRYVRRKLRRLGVADRVTLVPGLFQETLESLAGPFCFAFLDCDLHDSMLYAARTLWPRLAPGGCCVFDDYANDEYRGATRAVDTFIAEQAGTIQEHGRLCRKMYFATRTTGGSCRNHEAEKV